MAESQPAIERLPISTQAKLRSTQILTSLPQIVSELIQNSLDANATRIDVGVDCKEWMCWVRDDGHGISKDGLESLGQGEESGRYNTSKTYAPDSLNALSTFGFRGEALASAADISCLEICSRTSKSRNTWSIILKGGKQLYMGPAVRWKRESPGTAVCVRDAFYNLPVRRLSHPNPSRTWDLIRQEIETYSLMFPHVSFSIEDTGRVGETSQHKDYVIRIPKSSSTVASFRHLFGHALTEHVEEIYAISGSMKIEGFISLTGASSRAYQFLYINRHPITVSDLGRAIDSQFASSSFGKNALDEEGERDLPRSAIRRSPRKNEKKPVYVLNITIAPEEVDNCLDPSKSIVQLRDKTNVISFLSTTVQSFLDKNGFLYRNQDTLGQSTSSSPSPRKRKKLDFYHLDDSGYAEHESINEMSTLSLQDERRTLSEAASGDLYTSMEGPEKEIVWLDPTTGERFVVDSRTGHSFRQTGKFLPKMENEACHQAGANLEEGRRTLRRQKTDNIAMTNVNTNQSTVPAWLEQALGSNRAYAMTENRIPSVKVPPALDHITPSNALCHQGKRACQQQQNSALPEQLGIGAFNSAHDSSTYRFTKDDLRHAEVINQVDRKFIACRIAKRSYVVSPSKHGAVKPETNYVLVLIDQHAADERVRVERFLKELCLGFLEFQNGTDASQATGVRVKELTPPSPVLLTHHEALTIKRSQDVREMLRKWGVRFVEPSKVVPDSDNGAYETGSSTGYLQLLVSAIPEIVSDKLLQGDELRDFIKGFLGQIHSGELFSDSRLDVASEADQDEFLWLKAVRRCPRGLLELINSKACRGAIMFNDSLSVAQCEKLIKQLSETAFPFQCAHGRPSLVPLVETGALQARLHTHKRPRNDWTRLETMNDV